MKTSKILIVEDEAIAALDLQNRLRGIGYINLTVAYTGEEAIQMALEVRPDLVLMDIMLPGIDGITAAGQIKSHLDIPVIYITAYADGSTLDRAKKTEPNGYIVKPFQERDLVISIEMALYKHKSERKLKERDKRLEKANRELQKEITDRKQAEQELRQSEERFRVSVMNSSLSFSRFDRDARFTWIHNPHPDYKYSVGKLSHEVRDCDGTRRMSAIRREVLDTGKGVRAVLSFDFSDGVYVYDTITEPVYDDEGAVIGGSTASLDITERKRVEGELSKTLTMLRKEKNTIDSIFQAVPVGLAMADDKGGIILSNAEFEKVWGRPRPKIKNSSDYSQYKAWWPDGTLVETKEWASALAVKEGLAVTNQEMEIRRFDGTTAFVLNSAIPIYDSGKITGAAVSIMDISERKLAEKALRLAKSELEQKVIDRTQKLVDINLNLTKEVQQRNAAENALKMERKRLYDVLEALPAMVCLLTSDYHVAFANRSFRKKFGESGGRRCYEYRFGLTKPCEFCQSFKVLETGKPHHRELTIPDGTVLDAYDFPFTDMDGTQMILEMDIDITEFRRAEKQMRAAQKKLRAMASEIVLADERSRQHFSTELHDTVIQTIGAAKLRSQLIQDKIPQIIKPFFSEMQDFISQSITQARSIMSEMSPPVLYELGFIPALEWLTEQIGMQHGISVKFQVKNAPPMVHEAQVMLFQCTRELLMNIVKHAKAKTMVVKASADGSNLKIEIMDDGQGFETRQAFHTDVSGGGFGLFSIRERLRHFEGELKIRSKPGQGTKVTMTVPKLYGGTS